MRWRENIKPAAADENPVGGSTWIEPTGKVESGFD